RMAEKSAIEIVIEVESSPQAATAHLVNEISKQRADQERNSASCAMICNLTRHVFTPRTIHYRLSKNSFAFTSPQTASSSAARRSFALPTNAASFSFSFAVG